MVSLKERRRGGGKYGSLSLEYWWYFRFGGLSGSTALFSCPSGNIKHTSRCGKMNYILITTKQRVTHDFKNIWVFVSLFAMISFDWRKLPSAWSPCLDRHDGAAWCDRIPLALLLIQIWLSSWKLLVFQRIWNY